MKRGIVKLVVLFCIFAGCVIGFSAQMNSRVRVRTAGLSEPSLPVFYMQIDGISANRMVGHKRPLDEATERPHVTPLPTDRTLTVQVQEFGAGLGTVSYQVTDLADGSVVENGRVANFTVQDGLQTARFTLGQTIVKGCEYMLRFAMEQGGDTVYYYTRLVQGGGLLVEPYLSFAQTFYEAALSEFSDMALSDWLETALGGTEGLDHLTIASSEDKVRWNGLQPVLVRRGTPALREISEMAASVSVDYTIRCMRGDREELYEVSDFYRLRQGQEKMYLFNFERHTRQVFDGESAGTSSGLTLGVQSTDRIAVTADAAHDRLALVLAGDLWAYEREADRLTRVFTFRANGAADGRSEDRDHDIRVVRIDEAGNITFAVYGYMPSGPHEGENGLAVLQYQAVRREVEETVFLPLDLGYATLEKSVSRLIYANDDQKLYALIGDRLCRVDLQDAKVEVLMDGIDPDCFFVSESQGTAAWLDPMTPLASAARVLDLDSGRSLDISTASGEKLLGIGFFNEDFIYGYAKDTDIVSDASGNRTVGMDRILIQHIDGTVEKEYRREGQVVTGADWDGESLRLSLAEHTEKGFTPVGEDHIVNNASREEEILLLAVSDDRTVTHVELRFGSSSPTDPTVEMATFQNAENGERELEVDWPRTKKESYSAYGLGELLVSGGTAGEALLAAEAKKGVVLDEQQRYLWERGNWPTSASMNTQDLPACIANAELDESVLEQELGGSYRILNLTGCETESLRYFLARGIPVIAKSGSSESVLLVGYDNQNYSIYQGSGREARTLSIEEAEAQFAKNGNVFLVCKKE